MADVGPFRDGYLNVQWMDGVIRCQALCVLQALGDISGNAWYSVHHRQQLALQSVRALNGLQARRDIPQGVN